MIRLNNSFIIGGLNHFLYDLFGPVRDCQAGASLNLFDTKVSFFAGISVVEVYKLLT